MYDWPQTLAADRSVNALGPLAAGCHHIYYYKVGNPIYGRCQAHIQMDLLSDC